VIRLAAQCALTLLLCVAGCQAPADETLYGRAVRIFDGDSFRLALRDGGQVEVRLGEIDAPEKDQPHADESRAALRALIDGLQLRLKVIDVDAYQRKVARVYRVDDNLDVNAEMILQGHAWVYRRWVRDQSLYGLERKAREARRGLWALPEAQRMPPWRWRRGQPEITAEGTKIDRMFIEKFEDVIRANDTVASVVEALVPEYVKDYVSLNQFAP
jgi:endonuclease YncB( thermonuclease family)